MKLRTQISLLFFLFGLLPLFAALGINIPLIFDRIDSLYHKAYVQNLRAGFGDLDQHIARRHEMVRLLGKFPEPGMLMAADPQAGADVEVIRAGYIEWVNQVLVDQLDITRVLYLDNAGEVQYWLERNNKTGNLEPGAGPSNPQNSEFIKAGLKLQPGAVLTGPIFFNRTRADVAPNKYMELGLISPVVTASIEEPGRAEAAQGVVVVYMDVSGLASAYRGIYWVHSDGRYLAPKDETSEAGSAFDDFPGLEALFGEGELNLWEYQGQRVLWLPLFATERAGPLWVGRSVDPSPIVKLRRAIEQRVAWVVFALLVVVFIVARLIAPKGECLGRELTNGISRVLEHNEIVSFSWRRPEELRTLGKKLTRLSETNAEHNRALLDYARELEDSNRYKSEFLANVSHELRTPLNSILLLSKMLSDSGKEGHTKEERDQARVIHNAGSDLKALIDNILDLSRIEAHQMTLTAERVSLGKLLGDILDLLRPQYDQKGLTLVVDIDSAAPQEIVTDKEKLRQILVNFLSNAVKFTEEGGVSVQLRPTDAESDGNYCVRIDVIDTGIGIQAGKQEIIFEAFKQADGSTSRRFGGTGLGLTISRELAHLMGGEITLESRPDEGATFSLFLPEEIPLMREDDMPVEAASNRQPKEPEERIPDADYSATRVLLVDDDVRNLLFLTPLLENWGIDVMAAGDGQEALETLEKGGTFDVVLMDIMMPEMDGNEVIRQIRAQQNFKHLAIIALTGRAIGEDECTALQAGADECLDTPVEPSKLKMLLDKYLSGKSDESALTEERAGTA